MDDSTPSNELKPTQRIPLGVGSFGKDEATTVWPECPSGHGVHRRQSRAC